MRLQWLDPSVELRYKIDTDQWEYIQCTVSCVCICVYFLSLSLQLKCECMRMCMRLLLMCFGVRMCGLDLPERLLIAVGWKKQLETPL